MSATLLSQVVTLRVVSSKGDRAIAFKPRVDPKPT